jgi:hypothetical protein
MQKYLYSSLGHFSLTIAQLILQVRLIVLCYFFQMTCWLSKTGCIYFSYIMTTCFSGGRGQSTRREPPTMGKQLVNLITYGCESSAPFFCNLQSRLGDTCTNIDCCVNIDKLDITFRAYVNLDVCDKQITIGVENFTRTSHPGPCT